MCMFRDTSRGVDVSESDIFGTLLNPRPAALLKATNTQVNKARRKHGGSCFRWLKAFQENIFPVTSTELMNFH